LPHDKAPGSRYTHAMNDKHAKPKLNPGIKLALDLGPLAIFAVVLSLFNIFAATAALMAAVIVTLVISYALTRHVPIMPVVTAIVVLVFGSLTLILHNQDFIKLKPTIIYCLFGATLLGGYVFNKPLLPIVFDAMFHLTEEGWRKLTLRWALFFFVLAVGNEIARHALSDFWWGWSKLIVFAPLNFVFAALQYPLIMKYASAEPNPEAEAERDEG
jgi:intracellular septation protein